LASVANSPDLFDLVDKAASVECLSTGFGFTEGPVWSPDEYLLFSDITGDVIRRWDEVSGIQEWRRPSSKSNGLSYDADLRLIACEHATSRVTRTEQDGTQTTIASHYEGKELNSPNDVVVKSDGSIYFTDPPFGRMADFGIEREQELDFQGVYRVSPESGTLTLLVDDFETPNGLCFSPDESMLYVNDTLRMQIRVFNVRPDGTLEDGHSFFTEPGSPSDGGPDGMKVDEHGNLYCTGPGGIWVFSPKAEHLGTVEVPEGVKNLNWGDRDWKSLYITASKSLYRIRMSVRGARVSYMR
jgi:gluconolactonase